jgi:hypothetical protein
VRNLALATLLVLLLPSLTFSQSSPTDKVTQGIEWFSWATNVKVHKKVTLLAEGQFRFAGQFQPMQFQARTAAEFHIAKGFSVAPGYVYTWNPTYGKQPSKYVNNEHRIFEQVQYKHRAGRVYFSHRGRLEQRFIQTHANQNGEIVDEGYTLYTNRIRYRLTVNIPLGKKEIGPKTMFASVYDEVFMQFGKNIVYHKPDQNRLFAGVGYQANSKFTVTGGFLYHMLVKLNGVQQENNLGMQVNFAYNIDLTEK